MLNATIKKRKYCLCFLGSALLVLFFIGTGFFRSIPKKQNTCLEKHYAGVPCYTIEVQEKHLALVDVYIKQAKRLLTDDNKLVVPASFQEGEDVFPITMHVRGDQSNHWEHEKKSWRIQFADLNAHNGNRKINLILPEDRVWLGAMVNKKRALAMGFVQPDIFPVVVFINGVGPQVYLEVEHWSREMLERQGVSGNVYLYKEQFSTYLYEDLGYWDSYFDAESVEIPTLEGVELLLDLASNDRYKDPDFLSLVDLLFDRTELVNWYVHSLLSGNIHVVDDNIRLFFDLSTGKFHPIPWDVYLAEHVSLELPPGNPLWNQLFAHPLLQKAVLHALWEYVQNETLVQADIAIADEWALKLEELATQDPIKYQSNEEVHNDIALRHSQIINNIEKIRRELSELPEFSSLQ